MKKTVIFVEKPSGFIGIKTLILGERAQMNGGGGGMIGFYVTLMIAGILVMNVVWPTFDSIISQDPVNGTDKSYNNLSSTAKTIVGLFGLTLMLGLLIMILRPVM